MLEPITDNFFIPVNLEALCLYGSNCPKLMLKKFPSFANNPLNPVGFTPTFFNAITSASALSYIPLDLNAPALTFSLNKLRAVSKACTCSFVLPRFFKPLTACIDLSAIGIAITQDIASASPWTPVATFLSFGASTVFLTASAKKNAINREFHSPPPNVRPLIPSFVAFGRNLPSFVFGIWIALILFKYLETDGETFSASTRASSICLPNISGDFFMTSRSPCDKPTCDSLRFLRGSPSGIVDISNPIFSI